MIWNGSNNFLIKAKCQQIIAFTSWSLRVYFPSIVICSRYEVHPMFICIEIACYWAFKLIACKYIHECDYYTLDIILIHIKISELWCKVICIPLLYSVCTIAFTMWLFISSHIMFEYIAKIIYSTTSKFSVH